jgi:histidinol-phosphate phosphatase family protein
MSRKALFLDRDGIINEAMPRKQYLTRLEQFKLIPEIQSVIEVARSFGYFVVVVTNQGQINRGDLTHEGLREIHSYMHSLLPGLIDAVYYCPHTAEDNCDCRKPKPGMILKACKEHDLDPNISIMVGDGDNDVLAGQAVGCKTIFVKNEFRGHESMLVESDYVVESLADVLPILIKENKP